MHPRSGVPRQKHVNCFDKAFGRRYTRALNNGGKIKICEKHQTFEVIKQEDC